MFVKLLTATELIWTKRNKLDMIRYVLQKSFPWEIRKHIQGFREQKQQIHFKKLKYFFFLSQKPLKSTLQLSWFHVRKLS